MPKLTKEQLEKAKYVSMADFYAKIDQIEGYGEKMKFTSLYLLSHGANGAKTDYSFEEAVHLARVKLIDESKKLRDKIHKGGENEPDPAGLYINKNPNAVDPYAKEEKDDIENQFFMGNPAVYLKGKAKKYVREIGDLDVEEGVNRSFKQNCERLIPSLTGGKSQEIIRAEGKGMALLDIKARMEAKYRGRDNFLKGESFTRPSLFTRAFGTRSNAGKNFDEVYAAFNNPKHALYGNTAAMELAINQYLDYKASKRSTMENLAGLRVKEPKEGFAERLLDAIKEQRENDKAFKPIVGESYRKNLTQDSVDRIKGPDLEENNNRQPIVVNLGDDNEFDMDESMEDSRELSSEKEVEKEPEMSAKP